MMWRTATPNRELLSAWSESGADALVGICTPYGGNDPAGLPRYVIRWQAMVWLSPLLRR
jgi:hypothetical protein